MSVFGFKEKLLLLFFVVLLCSRLLPVFLGVSVCSADLLSVPRRMRIKTNETMTSLKRLFFLFVFDHRLLSVILVDDRTPFVW